MSNIHTLKDLEAQKPVSQPMPNPWEGQTSESVYAPVPARATNYSSTQARAAVNINGEMIPMDQLTARQLCCLMCCPACLGNPCEPERRAKCINVMVFSVIGLISVVQITMFIVSLCLGGVQRGYSFDTWLGPSASVLHSLGAKDTFAMKVQHQLWRFVTPLFLHSGILHLALNLSAQLFVGVSLESLWGKWRVLLYWLLAGMAGVMVSTLLPLSRCTESVGASGAILGLIGWQLSYTCCTWHTLDDVMKRMVLYQWGMLFILLIVVGLTSTVDNAGHTGGLVMGTLLGCFMFGNRLETPRWQAIVTWGSLGLVCAFWLATLLVFFIVPYHDC